MANPIRRSFSTKVERDAIIKDFEDQGISYQVVDRPPWRYVIQVERTMDQRLKDLETRVRNLETL